MLNCAKTLQALELCVSDVLSNLADLLSSLALWRVRSLCLVQFNWSNARLVLSFNWSNSGMSLNWSFLLSQVLDHQTAAAKPGPTFLKGETEYICLLVDPKPELQQENQRRKNHVFRVAFSTYWCAMSLLAQQC